MTKWNHTNTAAAGDVVRSEDWNADHVATQETTYLSIPATAFISENPDVEDVTIRSDGTVANAAASFAAPVFLPNGAIVTSVIMYGAAPGEAWSLVRTSFAGANTTMATAAIGTADSTITAATIDNETYSYSIGTSTFDATELIYGARITYTI